MGSVVSYMFSWVFSGTADTTPNPATGLSPRDRQLITQSWAIVSEKSVVKKNGAELMIQLFRAFPEIQDMFEIFKGKELEEIRDSAKMKAHSFTLFSAMTSYVSNLDDPETLVALVQKVATSHVSRHRANHDAFEKLRTMFVSYLKSILGSQCTPEMEKSWEKLLAVHNAVFKQTQDEIMKEREAEK